METITTTKKVSASKVATAMTFPKSDLAGKGLASIAKASTVTKISTGGFKLDAVIKQNKAKLARAQHNQERYKDLDGLTVKDALNPKVPPFVDSRDLTYAVKLGFITIGS